VCLIGQAVLKKARYLQVVHPEIIGLKDSRFILSLHGCGALSFHLSYAQGRITLPSGGFQGDSQPEIDNSKQYQPSQKTPGDH
jgi:hypothetical protein